MQMQWGKKFHPKDQNIKIIICPPQCIKKSQWTTLWLAHTTTRADKPTIEKIEICIEKQILRHFTPLKWSPAYQNKRCALCPDIYWWLQFYQQINTGMSEQMKLHLLQIQKKYGKDTNRWKTPTKISPAQTDRQHFSRSHEKYCITVTPIKNKDENCKNVAKAATGMICKTKNRTTMKQNSNPSPNQFLTASHRKFLTSDKNIHQSKQFQIYNPSSNFSSKKDAGVTKLNLTGIQKQSKEIKDLREKYSHKPLANISISHHQRTPLRQRMPAETKSARAQQQPASCKKYERNTQTNACIQNVQNVQQRIKSILMSK